MPGKSYISGKISLSVDKEIFEIEHDILKRATGLVAMINKRIADCAREISTEIKTSMRKTPRQRTRQKDDRRKFYKYAPSKPGHPPAIQTRNLYNSIQYAVNKAKGKAEVGVTVSAGYGKYLEYGAVRKGGQNVLLPRPFLDPAVEKKWPEMIDKVKLDIQMLTSI